MARPSFVLRRVLLALSVAAVGCTSSPPPMAVTTSAPMSAPTPTPRPTLVPATPGPATAPAVAVAEPQAVRVGPMRFVLPGDWAVQCVTGTGATRLRAVAPSEAAGGLAVFTVDVPSLPLHIPGLIPIGLVANGYADDVRGHEMADAAGPPPGEASVPDAKARRVTRTGHDAAGHATTDDAFVIVHGDAVYILSVTADAAAAPAATAALERAAASIRWKE